MTAKGWDQKDLAPKIPISEASISNMLKPGDRQIRYRKRLLEVLELEDYKQVLNDSLERMTADQQQLIVNLAKSLTAKR